MNATLDHAGRSPVEVPRRGLRPRWRDSDTYRQFLERRVCSITKSATANNKCTCSRNERQSWSCRSSDPKLLELFRDGCWRGSRRGLDSWVLRVCSLGWDPAVNSFNGSKLFIDCLLGSAPVDKFGRHQNHAQAMKAAMNWATMSANFTRPKRLGHDYGDAVHRARRSLPCVRSLRHPLSLPATSSSLPHMPPHKCSGADHCRWQA